MSALLLLLLSLISLIEFSNCTCSAFRSMIFFFVGTSLLLLPVLLVCPRNTAAYDDASCCCAIASLMYPPTNKQQLMMVAKMFDDFFIVCIVSSSSVFYYRVYRKIILCYCFVHRLYLCFYEKPKIFRLDENFAVCIIIVLRVSLRTVIMKIFYFCFLREEGTWISIRERKILR